MEQRSSGQAAGGSLPNRGRPAAAALALAGFPLLAFLLLFVANADASFLILLPLFAGAVARWWGGYSQGAAFGLAVGSIVITAALIGGWAILGLLLAGDPT
jgi:hypothetical protein